MTGCFTSFFNKQYRFDIPFDLDSIDYENIVVHDFIELPYCEKTVVEHIHSAATEMIGKNDIEKLKAIIMLQADWQNNRLLTTMIVQSEDNPDLGGEINAIELNIENSKQKELLITLVDTLHDKICDLQNQ